MNFKDIEHYGASIGDVFVLKITHSNILYGYSKNTASIRNYAYLSEVTFVRPTNSGPYNKPWVSCHI